MRSLFSFSISASSLLCFALALSAQDTRKVTEPHIPAACITLNANIAADHGVIASEDEQRLDTERIQHAMDNCAAGKAVVLRATGRKNVFLTGPIALRPGVTLVADANTALVASRDPRIYDLAPGSCGIVSEHGQDASRSFWAMAQRAAASWAWAPLMAGAAPNFWGRM